MPEEMGLSAPYASAFWGWFGRSPEGRHYARGTLFGHEVRVISTAHLMLWYTVPPAEVTSAAPGIPPRALFVGRPFALRPSDPASREESVYGFLRSLDGRFRLIWNRGESIVLATDILGAGAVYYRAFDECVFFGTHLGPLLAILPEWPPPHRLGIASILLSYQQLFDETHFAGVKRLQAAQLIEAVWNPRQAKAEVGVREYAGLAEILLQAGPPRGDLTAFEELLRASQEREAYDDDAALMLSGGHDSKAIALTRPPRLRKAISYGMPDSQDVRRGRRLARKLGMQHYSVPYRDWNLETYFDMIVGLNAGCSGLQTSYNIVAYDWARRVCNLAANGFLGDNLSGAHLRHHTRLNLEGFTYSMLHEMRQAAADAFPEELNAIRDRIASLFQEYRALPPAQALLILKLRFRKATWISVTMDLCDWMTPVSFPFFYRPLMQMLFQLPLEEQWAQGAYRRWLARLQHAHRADVSTVDALRERVEDRYHRWRTGRPPDGILFWPEIVARTDPAVATRYTGVMDELDRLTRDSWRERDERNPRGLFPLFVFTIPMAAALSGALPASSESKRPAVAAGLRHGH
jgi:hypothetical protein